MPRPRTKLDKLGQASEVLERLKTEPPGSARERLTAVKLGLEGELKLQEIAEVRAHKSSCCRYDWQYIWGALQVGGGGSEYLYTNRADGDVSAAFLKQISERDPYAIHIVIWDGALFHPRNTDPRIPGNVVVLRQPPHSPELNPVEKLWDMLRDWLCNRRWSSLDDLLKAVTLWLKKFWSAPDRILSLVGDGWMLNQANA